MATKSGKSVGNILGQSRDYWTNAAKQFCWPIDFEQLHISVPEKDLPLADDNLMVSHFKAHGWHIQSSIAVEYTIPFVAPVSNGTPIFRPIKVVEEAPESQFKLGDKFRIKSSDCELRISHFERGKIHLEYTNRPNKHNIITSEENLSKNIGWGAWIKF